MDGGVNRGQSLAFQEQGDRGTSVFTHGLEQSWAAVLKADCATQGPFPPAFPAPPEDTGRRELQGTAPPLCPEGLSVHLVNTARPAYWLRECKGLPEVTQQYWTQRCVLPQAQQAQCPGPTRLVGAPESVFIYLKIRRKNTIQLVLSPERRLGP